MEDKILALYSTILGKFVFFQKFIAILLTLNRTVEELLVSYKSNLDTTTQLKSRLDTLEERLEELEFALDEKIEKERGEYMTKTTASQIMQDFYTNYHTTNK